VIETRKNYQWVDKINLGYFGGACTCSDGSIHYVGEYRDSETGSCRHLACVNGISGECLRSAGKWSYGMTVCDSTDIEMSGNCLCKYGTRLPQGVLKCQDSLTCINADGIPACHDETSKATGGPLNCNVGIPVKMVNSEGTPYAMAASFETQLYTGTLLGIDGQYLGFLIGRKDTKEFYSSAKEQSYVVDIIKGAFYSWDSGTDLNNNGTKNQYFVAIKPIGQETLYLKFTDMIEKISSDTLITPAPTPVQVLNEPDDSFCIVCDPGFWKAQTFFADKDSRGNYCTPNLLDKEHKIEYCSQHYIGTSQANFDITGPTCL
jgi:hypothetical protein